MVALPGQAKLELEVVNLLYDFLNVSDHCLYVLGKVVLAVVPFTSGFGVVHGNSRLA